jgi:hypothetical protein
MRENTNRTSFYEENTMVITTRNKWNEYTGFVTRLTRRESLMEQELPTLPEHLSSSPDFSRVRITRSLVVYVCFVDRCLFFCTFSFGHCVVCSSSIFGFWLHLWYLQTRLIEQNEHHKSDVKTGQTQVPRNCKQFNFRFSMVKYMYMYYIFMKNNDSYWLC